MMFLQLCVLWHFKSYNSHEGADTFEVLDFDSDEAVRDEAVPDDADAVAEPDCEGAVKSDFSEFAFRFDFIDYSTISLMLCDFVNVFGSEVCKIFKLLVVTPDSKVWNIFYDKCIIQNLISTYTDLKTSTSYLENKINLMNFETFFLVIYLCLKLNSI